jgi:hypothetical protein
MQRLPGSRDADGNDSAALRLTGGFKGGLTFGSPAR